MVIKGVACQIILFIHTHTHTHTHIYIYIYIYIYTHTHTHTKLWKRPGNCALWTTLGITSFGTKVIFFCFTSELDRTLWFPPVHLQKAESIALFWVQEKALNGRPYCVKVGKNTTQSCFDCPISWAEIWGSYLKPGNRLYRHFSRFFSAHPVQYFHGSWNPSPITSTTCYPIPTDCPSIQRWVFLSRNVQVKLYQAIPVSGGAEV